MRPCGPWVTIWWSSRDLDGGEKRESFIALSSWVLFPYYVVFSLLVLLPCCIQSLTFPFTDKSISSMRRSLEQRHARETEERNRWVKFKRVSFVSLAATILSYRVKGQECLYMYLGISNKVSCLSVHLHSESLVILLRFFQNHSLDSFPTPLNFVPHQSSLLGYDRFDLKVECGRDGSVVRYVHFVAWVVKRSDFIRSISAWSRRSRASVEEGGIEKDKAYGRGFDHTMLEYVVSQTNRNYPYLFSSWYPSANGETETERVWELTWIVFVCRREIYCWFSEGSQSESLVRCELFR